MLGFSVRLSPLLLFQSMQDSNTYFVLLFQPAANTQSPALGRIVSHPITPPPKSQTAPATAQQTLPDCTRHSLTHIRQLSHGTDHPIARSRPILIATGQDGGCWILWCVFPPALVSVHAGP